MHHLFILIPLKTMDNLDGIEKYDLEDITLLKELIIAFSTTHIGFGQIGVIPVIEPKREIEPILDSGREKRPLNSLKLNCPFVHSCLLSVNSSAAAASLHRKCG